MLDSVFGDLLVGILHFISNMFVDIGCNKAHGETRFRMGTGLGEAGHDRTKAIFYLLTSQLRIQKHCWRVLHQMINHEVVAIKKSINYMRICPRRPAAISAFQAFSFDPSRCQHEVSRCTKRFTNLKRNVVKSIFRYSTTVELIIQNYAHMTLQRTWDKIATVIKVNFYLHSSAAQSHSWRVFNRESEMKRCCNM